MSPCWDLDLFEKVEDCMGWMSRISLAKCKCAQEEEEKED
jgi:hypothetical protein